MTYREKLRIEHPDFIDPDFRGGCKGCPDHYRYENTHVCLRYSNGASMTCEDCWDREIVSTADKISEQANSMVAIKLHPYCNDCPHFGPKMDITNMYAFTEKKTITCIVSCENYSVCEYMHDITKGEEK